MENARLADLVRRGWDLDVARLEPLRLGHDADARTFRAETADGAALFLKARPNLPSGLATAARFGFGFVPSPLPTVEGAPALWTGERWIAVYPFIEGENGFQVPLGRVQWRAFGAAMRRIHDLPPEVGRHLRPETFAPDGWESLRDLVAILPLPSEGTGVRGLDELVAHHRPTMVRLLRRTRSIADVCFRRRDRPFVLCHADAHVGNVLVDRAGRIHLIDWDEACLAPRERDLMFVVGGGIADWHGPAEETAFFEGYGPYEPDPLLLEYYRHAWAVSDLAAWSKGARQPAEDDPTQGAESLRYFAGLFDPGQIVEKALASAFA